jgi:hypothetical protein
MSRFWCGIALDWGLTIPSVIEPKDDKDIIRSSVIWIVLTRLGERVMLPEFGTNLPGAVGEPNDEMLANQLRTEVKQAIERWDDRVTFVDFKVEARDNTLRCSLSYKQNVDVIHDSYQVVQFEITPDILNMRSS